MRPIEALYQDGVLKTREAIRRRDRRAQTGTSSLGSHAACSSIIRGEDTELAEAGLSEWADDLDAQDRS